MLSCVKKRHIALLSLLAFFAAVVIFLVQQDQTGRSMMIRPYEQEKDFKAIVDMVNDNKFWISETGDFQPEKFLLTRAPSGEPERKGVVSIVVAEIDQKTAGFIAYYRKNAQHGFLWLLAVDKSFRGRGIGEELASHALNEMKNQGATYVTLAVRTMNKPALTLYRKLGFVEKTRLEEERGMVILIKRF